MKKIIGIIPKVEPFQPEKSTSEDWYFLGNNYTKRIQELGCLPICLSPVDGKIDPAVLDLCDGFLAQGGRKVMPYHFQAIHHAVNSGKRYLGICLGMQLVHIYFTIRKYVEQHDTGDDLLTQILDVYFNRRSQFSLLERVEGHRFSYVPRGQEHLTKHNVEVAPGTTLHDLTGKTTLSAASFHSWRVVNPVDDLMVSAWASGDESTIEGIEYRDYILGVQFHPEVDDQLPEIFRFFTK